MRTNVLKYLRYAFYSFPLQLLILHIKKHLFVLLFWIILFTSVLQLFGASYGIPLLFLDPEYLGNVNYLSFLIVGFTMGGFFMAWNMSFYVLNSYRFEFLASLVNPFVQFCLNNSLLPLAFTITYIIQLVKFQHTEALLPAGKIILHVSALLTGNLLMVIFTSFFFVFFNHDVETFLNKLSDKAKESLIGKKINLDKLQITKDDHTQWPVLSYLRFPLTISLVRKVDFYDRRLVDKVLLQHHRNAIIFQLMAIVTLIAFGNLMDIPAFRLPAASAFFLGFSVFIFLFSFLSYWFRSWRTLVVIVFFLVLNILTQYDLVVYKHKLYGLDYSKEKITYNNDVVNAAVNKKMIDADIASTKKILNNWHRNMLNKYGEVKPKLIFVNTSGGGLKATYWTFHLLQELERQTGGKFFDHTFLMTGASGGMLGAAYFRELYLRDKQHEKLNYLDTIFLDDMGKDMLNGMATSIITNDIFYPWQTYNYKGGDYKKDRAYMFNKKLNENTDFRMYKLLDEYKKPEQDAVIPMMIVGSTIINDQRFLFFSPQDISYLIKPYIKNSKGYVDDMSTDAVEYKRFFKDKGAQHLNFIDALRTNATYPYIMPAVYLPTAPEIKAMDAGIRENSGLAVSTRFYSVFKDWIDENTSGVIFISLRVDNKLREFNVNEKKTYLSELLSPVGSIFNNFILLQDYNSDVSLAYLENASSTDINVLNFNYDQTNKRKKASMSWHLTNDEKRDIKSAFAQENNQLMLQKLKLLLK
ncbi:MAG TPA: hypothetical protein PLX60_05200 [Chitinophagales bacterium]|nr:hypothetical protein [Chitinophagales bacterium]